MRVILIIVLTSLLLNGCSFKIHVNYNENQKEDKEDKIESLEDLNKESYKDLKNINKDFYDNNDVLVQKDDEFIFKARAMTPLRSRINIQFEYFRGFRTEVYFYRFDSSTDSITFTYTAKLNKGRCKLIIIDPSFKIVSTIELNGDGVERRIDVPIKDDGNHYVRLVSEDASGEVDFNARAVSVVYKLTTEIFMEEEKSGLYDYK